MPILTTVTNHNTTDTRDHVHAYGCNAIPAKGPGVTLTHWNTANEAVEDAAGLIAEDYAEPGTFDYLQEMYAQYNSGLVHICPCAQKIINEAEYEALNGKPARYPSTGGARQPGGAQMAFMTGYQEVLF